MIKPTIIKRSACDQCRAKRVRCLRAQNSTAPCARCSHIGARCVTGAPGNPGRPPKQRLLDGDGGRSKTPRGAAASSPAHASSPSPARHRCSSTLRDTQIDPLLHGPQPDFWGAPGDSPASFFGNSSIDQYPSPSEDMLVLENQLVGPSPLQGLVLGADDELKAMLHMGRDSSSTALLNMDIDPLLGPWDGVVLPPSPVPQCPSPASSLMRFREEMDQRIAEVGAYFSDPLKVVQGCKEDGAGQDAENPAALLLTCSKEFIDIIQSLAPPPTTGGRTHAQGEEDTLSTEVVLLALSSYLSLMRLFDTLFHTIHAFICQMPPDSFKAVKVKSVLRIGGIASLQDMPLKTYATGILDAIQGQMRTLERCMGIPTEYCLAGEAAVASAGAAPGIFSRPDRTRLFWTVMEQEDVKSPQSSKSYVESIRASIQGSMRFLDD